MLARSSRERSSRVSAKERREQYLTVAAELAVEQGVDAVTMEAVAAGAGVNKALLYRQFANRGELLLALFERDTDELDRRVVAATEAVDGFEDKVRAWVHAWFAHVVRNGRLMRRLMEARTVAPEVRKRDRDRQRAIDVKYGAWYGDQFGLPREVGQDVAAMMMSALRGAVDRWVETPTAATRKRLEQTYVDMILGSLERLAATNRDQTITREMT